MKAEIKPRINLENRTALEEVIPLEAPMVLFVDPSSSCNFRCRFCPTGDHKLIRETGRWQGQMDFRLFQKIVHDVEEFGQPLKVLRLYKDGEPLLNRNFAEMVRYAKKRGIARLIDTTTNGYLLEPERMKPILDAGLDRINISVDGMSDAQFLDFTGVAVDFERYLDNVRRFYEMKGECEVCIKIAGDFLTEEERERFFALFGDHADRIFVENTSPCWPEFDVEQRLGVTISKGIYDQEIAEVKSCPYIFYSMSINADGAASLCFLDWARKLPVGDVRTRSVKEIWEGEALFRYRVEHLRGQRGELPICANCGQMSHGLPDNIDPHADRLLEKLLASRGGDVA